MMIRGVLSAAIALASVVGASIAAGELVEQARVVLIASAGQEPAAADVQAELDSQLSSVAVTVDVAQTNHSSKDLDPWRDAASKTAAAKPGTLAAIGWSCGDNSCEIAVYDPVSDALVEIPVAPDDQAARENGLAFAIAATCREVVLGSLLPELERLADEGANPLPPPPTGDRVPKVYEPDSDSKKRGSRPWLWLEGGYFGEQPFPRGQPLHGPWVGLAAAVNRNVIPAVAVGWLGVRNETNERGQARSHRLPIVLELRIALPVGRSTFSVAPAGRVDVVFASTDPIGPQAETSRVDADLHLGGKTTWHLPLPGGIEASIGAGIYGTLLGRDYKLDNRTAIAASTLRFGWWIGIAWSPFT